MNYEKEPLHISTSVPNGTYEVTVTVTAHEDIIFTILSQSRRFMAQDIKLGKGESTDITFNVSVCDYHKNNEDYTNVNGVEIDIMCDGDFTALSAVSPVNIPTVYIAGDSTVTDQPAEYPYNATSTYCGWGQMFPQLLNTGIAVENHAQSGSTTEDFKNVNFTAFKDKIKNGDFLIIEFGHNDQKQKGPGKGAYYSFMTSLKTFIDEARARGAHPVLVTPTQRRSFDANGHIRDTHEDYPEAMRWLAAKENVPLIDLNEMTRTLYEALGPDTSKRAFVHYPAGTYPGQTRNFADNTHFNPYGAYQIAQCVIEGMKKAVPELAKHLKIDPAYNPAHPDDVNTFHWNDSPFTEIEKPDGN